MDASRLTDVRLRNAWIEPDQLTNLIERASELRQIEISFINCYAGCDGPRLEANKQLLNALSDRDSLTAIKFDCVATAQCGCLHFALEFVEMLKEIGRRRQLRKLAMEENFGEYVDSIDMNEICATICKYLPDLQSIKLHGGDISDGSILNVVSLPELEEIDVSDFRSSASIMKEIARRQRLKRLAMPSLRRGQDPNAYKRLVNVTTLADLRIRDARQIDADVWEKWSNGFASKLETFMVDGIEDVSEYLLVVFLAKAVRLRILIIRGRITDRSLEAIANSCPKLETLGVQSSVITIRALQEVVDRCPKLNRVGGFTIGINMLRMENYRKIVDDVDTNFGNTISRMCAIDRYASHLRKSTVK